MALSGSLAENVTPDGHVQLVFAWDAKQDSESLTSTVNWEMKLLADESGQIIGSDVAGSPWTVTVDEEEFSGTSSVIIGASETKVLASGQKVLTHEEDGTKTFDYEFSQYFGVSWDDTQISYITGSGTGELDTISGTEEDPEENPEDQVPETPVIKSFSVITKIEIDLAERWPKETISMVQGDISSRAVEIALTANRIPWEPEGVTGTVIYRRADGSGSSYDTGPDDKPACTIEGNIVTAQIAPAVLAVPGEVQVTVALSAEGKTLHTFVFAINVQRNPGYKSTPVDDYYMTGCVPNSGWEADKYLGTDENGNVVVKDAPEGTGAEVSSVSITEEAQKWTIALSLADGSTETTVLETDANNYPTRLTVNGREIPVTVTGV